MNTERIRPETTPMDPAAWDPIYAVAAGFEALFVCPVRDHVVEAMAVLRDLCDAPDLVDDDWAVDGLAYALSEILTCSQGFPPDRKDTFLQLVAAYLYHTNRNAVFMPPPFFWSLITELAGGFMPVDLGLGGRVKLADVLRRFLARYGLGGPDDQDLVAGLHRIVAPLVQEASAFLHERGTLLDPSAGQGIEPIEFAGEHGPEPAHHA